MSKVETFSYVFHISFPASQSHLYFHQPDHILLSIQNPNTYSDEMDTHIHPLPPRKRISLQHKQLPKAPTISDSDYPLPAKKRYQSRRPPANVHEIVTYPLPSKKRVRAFPFDLSDQQGGLKSSQNVVCDLDAANFSEATFMVRNRKRVCAMRPDFVLSEMLDLNVEYKPAVVEEFKLESDFGEVEITENKCSNATEELQMKDGLGFEDEKVRFKISDIKDSLECLGLETVCKLGDCGGEDFEGKISGVEDLGMNGLVEIVEREAEVVSLDLETVCCDDETDEKEIIDSESGDMVVDVGICDGFSFEKKPVEVKIIEGEERFDTEVVSNVASRGAELTESKTSEALEELSMNDFIGIKETQEKLLVEGAGLENVSDVDNTEISVCETGDEVLELGNSDGINQVEVNASENKQSTDCVEVDGVGNFSGNNQEEIDARLEGAAVSESESALLSAVTNYAGDFDSKISPGNINDSVVAESELLSAVNNSVGGNEGDSESEDGVVCEICQSTDGDPCDPIVFCDGCDTMVHASCYGNPLIKRIPEGDWFCDKCIFQADKPSKTISCCLCPSTGGVLKATNDGRWAHVVCTVFVPEAFFLDPHGREGIDVSQVCTKRLKKSCYVCEKRKGCVIDCSESKCCLSFHVTCGLKEDLCIEYKEGNLKKGGIVAGFCKDHTKLWKKQQQTGKFKIVARKSDAT